MTGLPAAMDSRIRHSTGFQNWRLQPRYQVWKELFGMSRLFPANFTRWAMPRLLGLSLEISAIRSVSHQSKLSFRKAPIQPAARLLAEREFDFWKAYSCSQSIRRGLPKRCAKTASRLKNASSGSPFGITTILDLRNPPSTSRLAAARELHTTRVQSQNIAQSAKCCIGFSKSPVAAGSRLPRERAPIERQESASDSHRSRMREQLQRTLREGVAQVLDGHAEHDSSKSCPRYSNSSMGPMPSRNAPRRRMQPRWSSKEPLRRALANSENCRSVPPVERSLFIRNAAPLRGICGNRLFEYFPIT